MKDKPPARPRTQVERSAATREALVAAGRALFAEHGFAEVGTETIVRAAGVTRGALYHHFADKTELFAAVYEAVEQSVTTRLDEAVGAAGTGDALELMKFGARAWLTVAAEPEVRRIALIDAPVVLGWARWREVSLRYGLGLVQSLLEHGISTGALPAQPPAPLAHVLIGALDEAALYVAQSDSPGTATARRAGRPGKHDRRDGRPLLTSARMGAPAHGRRFSGPRQDEDMDTYSRDGLVFDVTDSGPDGRRGRRAAARLPAEPPRVGRRHRRATAAGYRVLAPDQRGYSPGARPAGRRAYVASELVDDVVALIDAARRREGARRRARLGRARRLGAGVAPPRTGPHPDRRQRAAPEAFTWAMPRGQALKSWYMAVFQLPVLPERLLPTERGVVAARRDGLTADQVRAYVEPLGRDGLTAALNWYRALPWSQREKGFGRRTTVPTTYVWSDGDVALGRAGAEATERFVDAPYRFAVLEGLSHWIPDEAPELSPS